MTDRMTEMVKEIVYSDFADEIIVFRLQDTVEMCFEFLEETDRKGKNKEYLFDDYIDNMNMIRACIQVLQWFSVKDYQELTVRVNKHSRKFEEMF